MLELARTYRIPVVFVYSVAEPLIKSRNFDPESRTLKKRTQEDTVMQDTVENRVKGLAEQIIADDEKRRAQELVRSHLLHISCSGIT
jgi:hypothetical protein